MIVGVVAMRSAAKIHADILRMAKTKEKREAIKWFHARHIFFSRHGDALAHGLALARDSDHEDARFLVSLFSMSPRDDAEAAKVFLARQDDARCLSWAARLGADPLRELYVRSAAGGYSWGQLVRGEFCDDRVEEIGWVEKAVAQEDPDAMMRLAFLLSQSPAADGTVNTARIHQLYRQAAELGHGYGQYCCAINCCPDNSLQQFEWVRRAVSQADGLSAVAALIANFEPQLALFDAEGYGRIVFEIGAALFAAELDWKVWSSPECILAGERILSLFQQWCSEAKTGILCWIWLARKLGIVKDVRLMIADRIWDERAAWSEPA